MSIQIDPRDEVPEYPRYAFPQKGWHQVDCYAAALGFTRRQFLANIRKHSVPKIRIGNQILVNAEILIATINNRNDDDIEEG